MRFFSQIIRFVFFLAVFAALPAESRTTRSTEGTQDKRLVLYAIGNWKGEFAPDSGGRGGLAALHTFIERGRKLAEDEYGSSVFVHAGNFTGAVDEAALKKRLFLEEIHLTRYLGLEAAGFSPAEISILGRSTDERLRRLPAVSSNAKKPAAGVRKDRILSAGRSTVWVGSFTRGPEGEYDADPASVLAGRPRAQGADAFVILIDRTDMNDGSVQKLLGQMFALEKVVNPYDALTHDNRAERQTFVILGGAPMNRFYRLENGVRVCEIQGRSLCEVDLVIREDHVIGVAQRFVNVNGPDEPASWVKPDAVLQKLIGPVSPAK